MVKTPIGLICEHVELFWQNFRRLFHRNDSLFDIFFLLLYFFEQLGLVYFTIRFRKNVEILPYVISFFALFLLTTVGIHRLFMESKNRYIREQHSKLMINFYKLETSYKLIDREYKEQNKLMEEMFKDNKLFYRENERLKKQQNLKNHT